MSYYVRTAWGDLVSLLVR